jgi:enediyne biosynthesis protein E4
MTLPGARFLALSMPVLAGALSAGPPILFVDRSGPAGLAFRTTFGAKDTSTYILETTGTGVAFLDYDGDGRLDLFFANGTTLGGAGHAAVPRSALYRNNGDGTFADVTAAAGVARSGWGQGVAAGDYDNDGRTDLYLTFFGRNVLLRNKGDGTFADVTAAAGVTAGGWSTSAAFADYDNDGHLDMYVARYIDFDPATAPRPGSQKNCFYRGFPVMCGPRGMAGERDVLFRNNGNGTFTDVTDRAGEIDQSRYRGLGVVWGDYDDDGWPDVFVANAAHPNLLYHNERNGRFREVAFAAGVAFDEDGRERAGMGVDFGDYDNDGRLDLVVTNFFGEPHSLYLNQGSGAFLETTWPSGIGEATMRYLGWGTAFADFDNDGSKDLFFVNGHVYPEVDRHQLDEAYAERSLVFRNQGDGAFADVTASAGESLAARRVGRGAAFGDYDDDGRVDVVISTVNDRAVLLHNEGGGGNHWLTVKLVGRRANRDAIGARVIVRAGVATRMQEVHGGASYLSQSDLRAHFGLGPLSTVPSLEVRWPGGAIERFADIAADQRIVIEEGKGIVSRRGVRP